MARNRSDGEGTELSRALVALRTESGLRQMDVVARTSVSQSQLSRIEKGISLPTEDQAEQLCRLYGATPERQDEIVQMTKDARAGIRDTRLVVQRGNTLALQERWRRLEKEARVVRSYQPALVIGVLQTVEYSSVVLGQPADSDVVRDRQQRYLNLLNDPDREHQFIQTEGALRLRVGSADVVARQAQHLDSISRHANVRLGVIPESRCVDFTAGTAFHIYDDTAVVVGLEVAAATLTDAADVRHFRQLFDRLASVAVWDDEARAVIARVRASVTF
jgi:transcriptional regulator with XRE-family HTH domain